VREKKFLVVVIKAADKVVTLNGPKEKEGGTGGY